MTLSLDDKRLLEALAASLLIHMVLFFGIDRIVPSFSFSREKKDPQVTALVLDIISITREVPAEGKMEEELNPLSPPVKTLGPEAAPAEEEKSAPVSLPEEPLSEEAPDRAEPVFPPIPASADPPAVPAAELSEIAAEPVEDGAPEPEQKTILTEVPTEAVPAGQNLSAENPAEDSAPVRRNEPVEAGFRNSPAAGNAAIGEETVPVSFAALSRGRKLLSPSYPQAARRWKMEGTVKVAISIRADGRISGVELVSSSGHSILDREVLTTIRENWEFNPPGHSRWF